MTESNKQPNVSEEAQYSTTTKKFQQCSTHKLEHPCHKLTIPGRRLTFVFSKIAFATLYKVYGITELNRSFS